MSRSMQDHWTRGGGRDTAARLRLLCADGEEGKRAARVLLEEDWRRGSGSCPARWKTRGGGGETAARRRLLLARMGNRGGLGAAASTGGAGERVREGEQVGLPASAPLSSLISPARLLFPVLSPAIAFSCRSHPGMAPAFRDLRRIGRQIDDFRTPWP
jgi:hypothetical protein